MTKSKDEGQKGVGLDIGTMNLVAARKKGTKVGTSRLRDAFLDLPVEAKKRLKLSGVNYIEPKGDEDSIIVVGDAALEMANIFGQEVRRPLSRGLISAGEFDALEVLGILIRNVLGGPAEEDEVCYFSVPAAPVDEDRDVVYHQGVFERIVEECGFEAYPSNEAMAIIFSETAQDGFSGLAVSFGCLTPETEIITEKGLLPISEVQVGDRVLTRTGQYSPVAKTWVKNHTEEVYDFDLYGNPNGVTLTGNHEVWVQRGGAWSWVRADEMEAGDVVGEPVVAEGQKTQLSMCYTDRVTSEEPRKVSKRVSSGLARLLGYFLADGHLQEDDGLKSRKGIYITLGPNEHEYIEDIKVLVEQHFDRKVHVTKHGNAHRCAFSHSGLHTWLSRKCYGDGGAKVFPFCPEDVPVSAALGFLVGLVRGDGWVIGNNHVNFGNSSVPLVTAYHVLAGKAGFRSTITKREPRGATFSDGREILAENCLPEWTVHVTGADGYRLAYLVANPPLKTADKVWHSGGFRCTKIRSITQREYDGPVHDLTIDGDHSFVAPYMTLHNSGMCNIALAINGVEGLVFSVARGGDWIDGGAAKAVGSTSSRMCSIKEKTKEDGSSAWDLAAPEGRDQEALALYYKALIEYCIDNVAAEFNKIKDRFSLPKPIPIVLSGGTAMAGGFEEFFKKVFKKKQRKFPIEVSEIRMASDPLNAVARGLLVQAMQEYDEE